MSTPSCIPETKKNRCFLGNIHPGGQAKRVMLHRLASPFYTHRQPEISIPSENILIPFLTPLRSCPSGLGVACAHYRLQTLYECEKTSKIRRNE